MIRLIFSALLAAGASFTLPQAHAEEKLALSTSLTAPADPLTLSTARNIKLELIPEDDKAMNDLWTRIRGGFAMRDLDSPLIANHEKWYASRPDYVARMTDRARRYLYYIVGEVERRGMPSEIALLPMIESAFNPGAYSTSRASGIWQFIPSTGKNFGMQQNWWYDGRRDVITATNGALDYLQKLHDMFGDWELALAAYNWGEGAVQRAQARNRKRGLPVNYASLKMPDETRNYVPKLLAVKNIITNPASFGLVLQAIPNEPYFAAVSTAKHIDVKLAAQLADISMEEFTALNPAHNRPVILQDNSDVILLPMDKVEAFRANLEAYDKPLVSWQAYQPKKGERLDHLAPRFGLSVEKLKSVNGLSGRAQVSTGQTLLVPINGVEADTENDFEAFNMHLSPIVDDRTRALSHTVRKGETLASIARRYHVSIASLKSRNGQIRQVRVGQTLTIVQAAPHKDRLAKAGSRSSKLAKRSHGNKYASSKSSKRLHVAYNKR
ncbi:MAG TPA: transglycosylase SLT domain-containing protein [Gallionella sp.]|nr:transglycosylase SLT domain-containing protein [Gallionella sp.]